MAAETNEGVWAAQAREQLRPLLKLNDTLRRQAVSETDINVTTIVAVGDQSHGKSSVLEALSGIDLPRGDGIKTRVPLVLALRQAENGDEYAEISTGEAPKRIKLSDVAKEVEAQTAALAGGGKDVKNSPIELTVYRTDQDDLTLVDLPGMTRVAVDGQHDDIAATIKEMYQTYMEPEETIMLNVVSAMVDFSTSEALQLSRDYDPEGARTLLCVTKCDQHAEPGLPAKVKRASEQLKIPLEQIFCVRNRSQVENDKAVVLAKIRDEEAAFFHGNPEFDALPQSCLGADRLSKHLVQTQVDRIASTLPKTKLKVEERLKELEAELARLGGFPQTEAECRAVAHTRLADVLGTLRGQVSGRTTAAHVADRGGGSIDWGAVLTVTVPTSKMGSKKDFRSDLVPIAAGSKTQLSFDCSSETLRLCIDLGPSEQKCNVSVHFEALKGESGYPVQAKSGNADVVLTFNAAEQSPQQIASYKFFSLWGAEPVDVVFTVHVNLLEPPQRTEPLESPQMLCATLADLDDALTSNFTRLYPSRTLLGPGFTSWITSELTQRRGGEGLPGAILPEVPTALLRAMRSKIPPVLEDHAGAVATVARGTFLDAIKARFDEFPRLRRVLEDDVSRLCDEQEAETRSHYTLLLQWESLIHTSNHYFMDTVTKVRAAIKASREKSTEKEDESEGASVKDSWPHSISRADAKRLDAQGKSNEAQKVAEMQVEIYAYWKTMRKRLLDNAQACARWGLVVNPVDNLLHLRLQQAVETAAVEHGGLSEVMAPDDTRRRRFEAVSDRRGKLQEAAAAINQARAAWAGAGGKSGRTASKTSSAVEPTEEPPVLF